MKRLFVIILCLLSSGASAQSTAEQVQPGYLTTTGCPSGQYSCFKPYSSANPLPITGGGSVANGGTGAASLGPTVNNNNGTFNTNQTSAPVGTVYNGIIPNYQASFLNGVPSD